MARIVEIDQALAPRPPAATTGAAATSSFATTLASQTGHVPTALAAGFTGTAGVGGGTPAQRAVQIAAGEVGQTEQPPGSNDSPRIAQYRASTAGSGVGPWCSYFVSWAAQQAGTPLGESGQGFGSVGAVAGWAQRTGRWNAAGSGVPPQAGDLVVWGGEHIGIIESVDPDGTIHTIEGNSSNMVARRTHGADGDGATGFVRLG